ncbi:uncharacterized protein LOC144744955 [Ciona intestinalis]
MAKDRHFMYTMNFSNFSFYTRLSIHLQNKALNKKFVNKTKQLFDVPIKRNEIGIGVLSFQDRRLLQIVEVSDTTISSNMGSKESEMEINLCQPVLSQDEPTTQPKKPPNYLVASSLDNGNFLSRECSLETLSGLNWLDGLVNFCEYGKILVGYNKNGNHWNLMIHQKTFAVCVEKTILMLSWIGNRCTDCTLFCVPAKKLCKSAKRLWADDLEKVIRRFRNDKFLNNLYKRDAVKICEKHFLPSDIINKGTRKELGMGAIPTLNLPPKHGSFNGCKSIRPPPKPRSSSPPPHFETFNSLAQTPLPLGWTKIENSETINLFFEDGHDQPKLHLKIFKDFRVLASFYGWGAPDCIQLDVQHQPLAKALKSVFQYRTCSGLSGDLNMCHYMTKASNLSGSRLIPEVNIITHRAEKCQIFMKDGQQCRECECVEKKVNRNTNRRKIYKEKVKRIPLKRIQCGHTIKESIKCSLEQKDVRITELETKIKKNFETEERLVEVEADLANDFKNLMAQACDKQEVNDFYKLFWEEQIKLNGSKTKGERYHPEIIKFCLSLATKSKSCYEELRESGLLRLPSSRTLNDYRNLYSTSPGIQQHVLQELKLEAVKLQSHQRLLVMSLDEMKVKENIVYDATTDSMVGFVDLGAERKKETIAASHVLQLYVRSITSQFSRPLAFFSTHNTKAYELASMFWEAVSAIADCDFTIIALVADGAACNRKLFSLLNNLDLDIPYKCTNIYQPELSIFLISDPPHLLKTACNNVRSSRPTGARLLKYSDHFILWEHFCRVPQLFETDELRCCKLHDGHFSQKSFAKMRVSYAAQLLSNTVASLMESRGGDRMKRSAWFARLMNRWFDLMNTRLNGGYNKDLQPYRSPKDPRLSWLKVDFLNELQNWKESITGDTATAKGKQFLSQQTYDGLVMSTRAMVELIEFIFSVSPSDTYILTEDKPGST